MQKNIASAVYIEKRLKKWEIKNREKEKNMGVYKDQRGDEEVEGIGDTVN